MFHFNSMQDKRSKFSRWPLSALLLAMLLFSFTAAAGAQGNVLSDPPQNYELVQGWYQGSQTFYYEFGANSPLAADGLGVQPAPIYVLVTGFDADGNPQVVDGQHNIVDVIPGDAGYSDLWQVTFVTVPADYTANSITSADELAQMGYPQTAVEMYVNCPIVPAGSTLAEGGDLVQGWYKGQSVFYFEFGLNPPVTAPIYVLVTGFDADGNPQVVDGQANIIDVIPGNDGYSAFWKVNFVTVPADYTANTITAAADLLAMGYDITTTDVVVNCPVIRTDDAMMAGDEAMMAGEEAMMDDSKDEAMMAGEEAMIDDSKDDAVMADAPAALPATGGEKSSLPLEIVWGLSGLLLFGAGLVLRRKFSS